jgi:hypothetical protein
MNAIRVSLLPMIATLPMLATFALAAPPPADFAGKWEFNPALSKNIGMMSQMKLRVTIKQTSSELAVTSVSTFNESGQTSEARFDLAGKPVPNKNPMEATAETVTKWDGNRLVTTWTSPGSIAGTTNVRIETRSLSEDGRTMTVESKRGSAPPIVMIYERK